MLELFSRKPDALSIVDESHLTPIPTDEQISSLSAILLEDAYYEFLHSGRRVLDGVPFVGPEHLIPLKAKAWLDLTKRRESGESMSPPVEAPASTGGELFSYREIKSQLDITICD